MSLADTLQTIFGHYNSGHTDIAIRLADDALATNPGQADLLRLKAMSLRKAGRMGEALNTMLAAVNAAPANPEFQNTYGLMLKAVGSDDQAEISFRYAIRDVPDYWPAYKNLIGLLIEHGHFTHAETEARNFISASNGRQADAYECLGRTFKSARMWVRAVAAYEQCLLVDPKHVAGRYGLSACLIETGQVTRAGRICESLLNDGHKQPEIVRLYGRILVEAERIDEASEQLREAMGAGSTDALKDYSNLLWMSEKRQDAINLLNDALGNARTRPDFALTALDQLAAMDSPEMMRAGFERLPRELREHPVFAARLSMAEGELGNAQSSFEIAEQAYTALPDHRYVAYQRIMSALMTGRYDLAQQIIAIWRLKEPLDQHWIALEADAYRVLGQTEKFEALYDFDRLVKRIELPVPKGYQSMEAFHEDFIEQVHGKAPFLTHPLGQSARQGTQVQLNFMFDDRPVVKAYFQALHQPVREYLSQVGNDPGNPLTARNTGQFHINGLWSIYLRKGGRHVNHVHPEGWVSSAYYVAVPPEVDTSDKKAGWIKFGETPYKMPAATPALKWIKPTPGSLVLFPAYMWHGTVPISGEARRVTAPLDVLPGAAQ